MTGGSVVEGLAADDGRDPEDELQVISREGFLTWMSHINSYNRNGSKIYLNRFKSDLIILGMLQTMKASTITLQTVMRVFSLVRLEAEI